MRPLDMLVNINALPEFARQASADIASVEYRQTQEMGRARQENLLRKERVNEAVHHSNSQFNSLEPKYEGYSARSTTRLRMEKGLKGTRSEKIIHNYPTQEEVQEEKEPPGHFLDFMA